jgi:large subunit ribosomal protein L17
MRHGKKFNHLGRKKGHRDSMLANMASSLILHKRINTTLAKAKALRVFVEPILTKAKDNTTHSRRTVFSDLQNKEVLKELFDNVAEKIANRPGGYCRIIKTGFRKGDGAELAMVELVDYNTVLQPKTSAKASTRRSRRKGGSGATAAVATTTAAATASTIPVNDTTGEEE